MLTSIVEPNNLRTLFSGLSMARDLVTRLREDGAFVSRIRRALLRMPFEREPTLPAEVLPDLRASEQLRWSGMLALAREQARLAGERLVLLHPVPYPEVRGAQFYETFLDRSRWPSFMLAGRTTARDALLRRGRTAEGRQVPSRVAFT